MDGSTSNGQGLAKTHRGFAVWRDSALALLVTVGLCAMLWWPGDSIELSDEGWNPPPGSDKVVHLLLFGAETWFLDRALRHRISSRPSWQRAAFVAGVLAVTTEIGQLWVPERYFDGFDLVADGLGIFLCTAWLRHRGTKSHGARTQDP